MEIKRLL